MNPTGDPTLDRWPSKVRRTEEEEENGAKEFIDQGNLEERKCNKS